MPIGGEQVKILRIISLDFNFLKEELG